MAVTRSLTYDDERARCQVAAFDTARRLNPVARDFRPSPAAVVHYLNIIRKNKTFLIKQQKNNRVSYVVLDKLADKTANLLHGLLLRTS